MIGSVRPRLMLERCRWLVLGLLVLLAGCAGDLSGSPPPSQAEQLCKGWGYAPNDPVCLNTFRRTGGQ
jgi:hypothetical protein